MNAFRVASVEDVEEVLGLMRTYYEEEAYPFDAGAARAALDALLRQPTLGRIWVAAEGPRLVAYVVLTLGYSMEYRGRDAFVDEVFVASSHRGQRLGDAALAVVEGHCRELGVRALHLEVERGKRGVQDWYRRAGFEDHDRLLMTKRLSR